MLSMNLLSIRKFFADTGIAVPTNISQMMSTRMLQMSDGSNVAAGSVAPLPATTMTMTITADAATESESTRGVDATTDCQLVTEEHVREAERLSREVKALQDHYGEFVERLNRSLVECGVGGIDDKSMAAALSTGEVSIEKVNINCEPSSSIV